MRELSLFSGACGGVLATKHLLNWETIGYVEINDFCQRVIAQRIKDGFLDNAPIFTDIRTFIDSGCCDLYRGVTDVITAGFPCQDISCAGSGKGLNGERSGLWKEMAQVVCKIRPEYVFVENSPMLTIRGLGTVLRDLAQMGFDARWGVFSSADVGACHIRERIWIFAYSKRTRPRRIGKWEKVGQIKQRNEIELHGGLAAIARNYDGLADRLDRKQAIGNGQDPRVVEVAWKVLSGEGCQP